MKALLSIVFFVGCVLTLTLLFPGRTHAIGCNWTPQRGQAQRQQQPPVVDVTRPVHGERTAGDPTGTGARENVRFWFWLEIGVRVWPSKIRPHLSSVTVYYRKGTNEGCTSAAWQRDDTDDGCSYYRAYLDLTRRYTSVAQGDYELRATCVFGGYTYNSRTKPHFRIAKGAQMWYVATANAGNTDLGSWLHYPYHYGSKGPFSPQPSNDFPICNGAAGGPPDHAMPVDGTLYHGPYDGTHPAGNAVHPACFDCTGFTWTIYDAVFDTEYMPRGNAQAQYDALTEIEWGVNLADVQEGDLVFYGSDTQHIRHVALVGQRCAMAERSGTWTLRRDTFVAYDSDNNPHTPIAAAGISGGGIDT